MTSPRPRVGDIWLSWVEFSDHPGVGKVRPVIVVDVRERACTVIAAKVTSKNLEQDGSGLCVAIADWEACGLRKPSYARLDQKFELAWDRLLRDAPIGRLSGACLDVVVRALRSL